MVSPGNPACRWPTRRLCLIDTNGTPQLLSIGADSIVAYNPENGDEYWWFRFDGYSNVPRPIIAKGLVFLSSGYDRPEFYAVRVDGSGDVTESHLAWSVKKATPLNPSPLAVADDLYLISDNGIATCLDGCHWRATLAGTPTAGTSPHLRHWRTAGSICWTRMARARLFLLAGRSNRSLSTNWTVVLWQHPHLSMIRSSSAPIRICIASANKVSPR